MGDPSPSDVRKKIKTMLSYSDSELYLDNLYCKFDRSGMVLLVPFVLNLDASFIQFNCSNIQIFNGPYDRIVNCLASPLSFTGLP